MSIDLFFWFLLFYLRFDYLEVFLRRVLTGLSWRANNLQQLLQLSTLDGDWPLMLLVNLPVVGNSMYKT